MNYFAQINSRMEIFLSCVINGIYKMSRLKINATIIQTVKRS